MYKFNIGDKVKLISTDPKYSLGKVRPGDIGTVCRVYTDDLYVDFSAQKQWRALPGDLELVEAVGYAKQKLKSGMLVELRNGNTKMVMLDTPVSDFVIDKDGYFLYLSGFDDDLTFKNHIEFDVVKVFIPHYQPHIMPCNWEKQELLWERKEPPIEVTIEEIARIKGVDPSRIRIKKEEEK